MVVVNYIVHYERYANELCKNKDIPESMCNGKCEMMKELNKTESSSSQAPVVPNYKIYEQPFEHIIPNAFIPIQSLIVSNWLIVDVSKLQTGNIKRVFHPPCYS